MTTYNSETPCPEPNPTPNCENGTLVPIYHPVTQCLIGYNCLEDTTTSVSYTHLRAHET